MKLTSVTEALALKHSPSSHYFSEINSLNVKLGKKIDWDMLSEPHVLLQSIEKFYPTSLCSQRNHFNAVFEAFRCSKNLKIFTEEKYENVVQRYINIYADLSARVNNRYIPKPVNIKSETLQSISNFTDVTLQEYNMFKNKCTKILTLAQLFDCQVHIIKWLYNFQTLRNDYRSLKFRNFLENRENYINESVGDTSLTLHIHNFKTDFNKRFHVNRVLPPNLSLCISNFISHRKKWDGDFIFVKKTSSSNPYTSPQWTKFLQNIYGHGTQTLRRLNASIQLEGLPSNDKLFTHADHMQHDLVTHFRYRFSD